SAALGKLALDAQFSGSDSALAAEKLTLTLDETQFDGNLRLAFPADGRPAIALALKGGQMNLDRYLPPEEEDSASGQQAQQQAPAREKAVQSAQASAPAPLPLDALRSADAELQFAMDQLVVQGMTVTQPTLALS